MGENGYYPSFYWPVVLSFAQLASLADPMLLLFKQLR